MFGLNPYALAAKAAVVLACLVGGFWAGHKVTSNAWRAEQVESERRVAEQYRADVDALNAKAEAAEQEKERLRASYRDLSKKADKLAKLPQYAGACLDDAGVRLANQALSGAAPDPGELDAAMPASGATGGGNRSGGPSQAR